MSDVILNEAEKKLLEELEKELADIRIRIEKTHGKFHPKGDPYLKAVGEAFHLGRVGGSGRNVHGLNKRREQAMDKSISQAVAYCDAMEPLRRQEGILSSRIDALRSGKETAKRIRAERLQEKLAAIKVGDVVTDCSYGICRVLRVNRMSLTIQTPSGFVEARPKKQISSFVCDAGRVIFVNGNNIAILFSEPTNEEQKAKIEKHLCETCTKPYIEWETVEIEGIRMKVCAWNYEVKKK